MEANAALTGKSEQLEAKLEETGTELKEEKEKVESLTAQNKALTA